MSAIIPPPLNDARQIIVLRVAVQSSQVVGPTMSENHWMIYVLPAVPRDTSVRANMKARLPGDQEAQLEWTTQNYQQSTSELRHWDFTAASGLTISSFSDFIYRNQYQFFILAGGGSGCRHWV